MSTILVMAKSPVPGRVKTRLVPPLTHDQAAAVAAASLADTLEAVLGCSADRRVLALDGPVGDWLPEGFLVIPQRGRGLAARLAAAWGDAGGPAVQIGMDTPHITAELLDHALSDLDQRDGDAVLGLAEDGGWWAIGLRTADARVFEEVPMSAADTGARQRERLTTLGYAVRDLPMLRDIDTVEDLVAVARSAPHTRTARIAAHVIATQSGRLR